MAAVDTATLEQVLGRDCQLMGVRELSRRQRQLETAAGFTHTLDRCMNDLQLSTAGQALAVLAERVSSGLPEVGQNGNGAVAEPPRREESAPSEVDFRAVAEALGFDLGG